MEAPREPYLEIRIVARNDYDDSTAPGDGDTVYHLGLRTREGWFWLEEFARTSEPAMGSHHEWLVVESMRFVDAGTDGPPLFELRYAWHLSDDDRGSDENIHAARTDVVVCGLTPAARPRCTAPTRVAESGGVKRISTGADVSSAAWHLELRYGPKTVELALPAGASGAGVPPVLVGVRPLTFDDAAAP